MDATRGSRPTNFSTSFIGEMAGLFPDQYFHIGGDEVKGKAVGRKSEHPGVQAGARLQEQPGLAGYFNQRVQKIVSKHGKIMIGWDEILRPELPKEIVIQSWRGQAVAGRCRPAGLSRDSVIRLLPRSDLPGFAALRGRSDERRGATLNSGRATAHSGRRSLHVVGIRVAGKHRLADLAAHGGDRRAPVVAAGCQRRRFDVSNGCRQPAGGWTGMGLTHNSKLRTRCCAASLELKMFRLCEHSRTWSSQ